MKELRLFIKSIFVFLSVCLIPLSVVLLVCYLQGLGVLIIFIVLAWLPIYLYLRVEAEYVRDR